MSGAAAALAEALASLPAGVRWGPLGVQLLGGLLLGAGAARATRGSPGAAPGALLGSWLVATTWARSAVPSPLDVPREALIPAAALGWLAGVWWAGGLGGRGPLGALRAALVADLPAVGLGLLTLLVPDRAGAVLGVVLLAVPMVHVAAAQGFGAVLGGAAGSGASALTGAAAGGGSREGAGSVRERAARGGSVRVGARGLLHLGLLLLPLGLRRLGDDFGLPPALVLTAVLAGMGAALDAALRGPVAPASPDLPPGAGRPSPAPTGTPPLGPALLGAAWGVAVPSLLLLPLPAAVAPLAPFVLGQAGTEAWLDLAAAEPDEGRRVLLLQATMASDPTDPRAPARLALLLASRGRCADAVRAGRAASGLLAARERGRAGADPGAGLGDPGAPRTTGAQRAAGAEHAAGDDAAHPRPDGQDEAERDVELAARAIAACFGPPGDPPR